MSGAWTRTAPASSPTTLVHEGSAWRWPSLTGGMVSSSLAKAPGASSWLVGGVVAYMSEVKHEVLGVESGPVVTEAAALQMARGVARLFGADNA